jgi:hypothetical protein
MSTRNQTPTSNKAPISARGKNTALFAFSFGFTLSVIANVLHAASLPGTGSNKVWSVLFAIAWPVVVALSVELLVSVRWPVGWVRWVVGYGTVGTIGMLCFIISYGHVRDTMLSWHASGISALCGPAVLDLLMAASSIAYLVESGRDVAVTTVRKPKPSLAQDTRTQARIKSLHAKGRTPAEIAVAVGRPARSVQNFIARNITVTDTVPSLAVAR